MSLHLPNGPAQSLGDRLATGIGLTMLGAGTVHFVGPTNASDVDLGLDPLRPLATVGQAITNAADDDLIVLMDGLTANFAGNLVIAKKLIFAAGGLSGGAPTVKWGLTAGGISVQATVADIEFRNITFTAPAVSNSAPRVIVSGADCLFRGCRFEMNGNDAGSAVIRLDTGADRCRFEQCTFVVTSTSVAARPPAAIYRNGTGITRVDLIDCILDGGTTGFDTAGGISRVGAAVDFGTGVGATKWRIQNLTLLRGPDVVSTSVAIGHIQIQSNTGGSKVLNL